MQGKAKLYFGWLIASICSLIIGIVLLIVPSTESVKVALQNTIKPEVTEEVVKYSVQDSKLPIIYVDLGDKNYISSAYTPANVTIINNFKEGVVEYEGSAELKIRGNSTATRPKLPYKLKLETKSDLFDMGESKHWVLLANDIDHTFYRNKLVCDFYNDIGGSYSPSSLNAILMVNGKYQGVYTLSEQIRIDEERVDIFDWEELAEEAAKIITKKEKEMYDLSDEEADAFELSISEAFKNDFSWITAPYTIEHNGITYDISEYVDIPEATGGFILEMDFYHANLPANSSLKTAYQLPWYFSEPALIHTNKELFNYAKNYIQSFEYALHSNDFFFKNSDTHYTAYGTRFSWNSYVWRNEVNVVNYTNKEHDGKHYSELFDLESLVTNFWVCEFTMNWDSMKNSTFITKDIGELAKLAPVWDYDWAFGNNNMYNIYTNVPEEWHTTNEWFTNEQYYQAESWNRYLIRDPYFLLKAYEKYEEIRPTVIEDLIKTNGTLDKYTKLYKEDGKANDKRWSSTYRDYNGETFTASMNSLKSFIKKRIAFIDREAKSFDAFVDSLGYYDRCSDITITETKKNSDGSYTITAKTSESDAKKLSFQVNGKNLYTSTISNGKATIEVPKDVILTSSSNIVVVRMLDSKDKYIMEYANTSDRNFNPDHVEPLSNYKVFE